MNRILFGLCAVVAAGCSTAAKDIEPSYASPLPYQGYTCQQLADESARVDTHTRALGQHLDEAARNDKGIMVVGALFFWPALFALGGTKEEELEYARLRGEYDALQQTAAAKGCTGAGDVAASAF